MYVWCDALTNYISALGYAEDSQKFRDFWPADLHIIGKDILRFHAAIWPGMLLSAKLPLPKALFAHGFITIEGKKMSKTLGNVIDPLDLIEDFGVDAVRYYLLAEISPFNDGDFSESRFLEVYNSNLADALGNLVQRTAKMALSYFGGIIEKPDENVLASVPLTARVNLFNNKENNISQDRGIETLTIFYTVNNYLLPEYEKLMNNLELNKTMSLLWSFIAQMDKYIDEYKPFKLIKEDEIKTKAVLWHILYGISALALCLRPFMPETAEKIFNITGLSQLNQKDRELLNESVSNWSAFKIKEELLLPLFPKKEV